MTEPEILLPVTCPVCQQEKLTEFRISVVAEALVTGDIRLYASCHLAAWDAREPELEQIREFLDTTWSEKLREACQELSLDELSQGENLAFIYTGFFDGVDADTDSHS